MNDEPRIAYFSMEIAVDPDVPTYSGGLGMLAGDTIRSAADLHVPMVAVTLLARRGYFFQKLDGDGVGSKKSTGDLGLQILEERPRQFRFFRSRWRSSRNFVG